MKTKWVLLSLVTFIVAAVVCGGVTRSAITDYTSEDNWQEHFLVPEMSEARMPKACELARKYLPSAPYILRVEVLGDLETGFYISQQRVKVVHVYAGEGLEVGDEFYLYGQGGGVSFTEPKSIQWGYVNIMDVGREYLVFLEAEVDTLDSSTPVYQYYRNIGEDTDKDGELERVGSMLIEPIFCYDHKDNVAVEPESKQHTGVPYSQVKNNEFFGTTQETIDLWEELKAEMLQRYPR